MTCPGSPVAGGGPEKNTRPVFHGSPHFTPAGHIVALYGGLINN